MFTCILFNKSNCEKFHVHQNNVKQYASFLLLFIHWFSVSNIMLHSIWSSKILNWIDVGLHLDILLVEFRMSNLF